MVGSGDLSAFLIESRSAPFVWGQNDCALWAADAVRHMTGHDPAHTLRGTYASWVECRQLIMRSGGLLPLIAPFMNAAPLRDIGSAQEGVAVLRSEGVAICGVVVAGRAVLRKKQGLHFTDDYEILRGWTW